jgi:hypothetical protein
MFFDWPTPKSLCFGQEWNIPARSAWSPAPKTSYTSPLYPSRQLEYASQEDKDRAGPISHKHAITGLPTPRSRTSEGPSISNASFTTSQPIGPALCLNASQSISYTGRCYSRPNTVLGLASSPHQPNDSWTLRPVTAAAAAVAMSASLHVAPPAPHHTPDALLLSLLRVCAATTPAVADPALGPPDSHGLLLRLIHAEAAAAALRQQLSSAQTLAPWR